MKRLLRDTNSFEPLLYGRGGSNYRVSIEEENLDDIVAKIAVVGDDGNQYTLEVDLSDGKFPAKWNFRNASTALIEVDFDDERNHQVYEQMKEWHSFATAIRSLNILEPFDDGTGISNGFEELKVVRSCSSYYNLGSKSAKRGRSYNSDIIARDENGDVIRGRDGIAVLIPMIERNIAVTRTTAKDKLIWLSLDTVRDFISGRKKEMKFRTSIYRSSSSGNTYITYPFTWKLTKEDIEGLKKAINIANYYADGAYADLYVGYKGYGCVYECSRTKGYKIPDYIIPHESGNSFDDIVKAYEDSFND